MEFTFDLKHGCLNLFHCSFHVHFSHFNGVRTFACFFSSHFFMWFRKICGIPTLKYVCTFKLPNRFEQWLIIQILSRHRFKILLNFSSIFFVHFVSTNIQYFYGVCIVSKIEKSCICCHTQLSKKRECVLICFLCSNKWHRMCVCV